MKTHCKKLTQPYFNHVRLGIKSFELRRNDCDYQIGDILILKEYDPALYLLDCDSMGREITARITYMIEDYDGLEEGYCILGIEVLEK